jgi:ABC-type lipoprotein release transport system permease subunit
VNSKLVLSSTDVNGELIEDLVRIKGIFKMGSAEVDGHLAEVPIDFARRFFGLEADQATQVGIVLENPDRRDTVMAAVKIVIPQDVAALPWEAVLPDLANYVRIDRGSNQVFQGIIIFLCLFTILNTILMSVLERTREFAVMMALGTPIGRLRGQIMLESVLLASLGVAVGLALGGGLAGYFEVVGLDMSSLVGEEMDVSGFAVSTKVHAKVTLEMLAILGGGIFGATLLMSLFAMRRVKRIDVAEVLR